MRFLLLLLAAVAVGAAAAAQTARPAHEPFTQARFEALQRQNALILVDVYADWCPTCEQQQRLIAAYRQANPRVALHVLRVNYDEQRDVVRRLGAPRQSTLFLYRGGERLWMRVADTRRTALFAALDEGARGPVRPAAR